MCQKATTTTFNSELSLLCSQLDTRSAVLKPLRATVSADNGTVGYVVNLALMLGVSPDSPSLFVLFSTSFQYSLPEFATASMNSYNFNWL